MYNIVILSYYMYSYILYFLKVVFKCCHRFLYYYYGFMRCFLIMIVTRDLTDDVFVHFC